MDRIDRRTFCLGLGAAGLLIAAGLPLPASATRRAAGFTMWHSPGCGCCLEWQARVEALFGRRMEVREIADMAALKSANGVPQDLWSCHTARIGSVVVEGHVPPADIRRLIDTRGAAWAGLAVPGMPLGSPGMDVGHNRREPYDVIAFGGGRRTVWARHGQS
ncbi:MAG: DUF411 domain-containing protein [Allosphingosinicella sp.]|uniref:DUF411 domain-containing protein n=1 Tax=Allosphingosinicella sp. TaxID=2823234 RepID=UPI0039300D95